GYLFVSYQVDCHIIWYFYFSSRRRHTRSKRDWSSDVCSSDLIQLIDNLGNRKMQVVKYILENMEKSTNTLIITTTELAKKSKVSRQTVSDTLKILEESQIIARKTGAIMIHSNLVH